MDPLDQRIKEYFQSIKIPESIYENAEGFDLKNPESIELIKPSRWQVLSSYPIWGGFIVISILVLGTWFFIQNRQDELIIPNEKLITAQSLTQIEENVLDQWIGKYYGNNEEGGLQLIIEPDFLVYQKDFWSYSNITRNDTTLNLDITNVHKGFLQLIITLNAQNKISLMDGDTVYPLTRFIKPAKYIDFPIDSSFNIQRSVIRGHIYVDSIDPMVLTQIRLASYDYAIPVSNKPLEITKDGRFELELDKSHTSEVIISLPDQLTTSIFINPGQEVFLSIKISPDSESINLEFMSEYAGNYDSIKDAYWQNLGFLKVLIPQPRVQFNFSGTDMTSLYNNITLQKNQMLTQATSRFQNYPSQIQKYFYDLIKNYHVSSILSSPYFRRRLEYQNEQEPIMLPYRFYSILDSINREDLSQIHHHSYYLLLHQYRNSLKSWTESTGYIVGKALNILEEFPLRKSEKRITNEARRMLTSMQDLDHVELLEIEKIINKYGEETIKKKLRAELNQSQSRDAKVKIGRLMENYELLFQLAYYATEVIDYNPLDSVIKSSLQTVEKQNPTLGKYFETKIESRKQYYNGRGLNFPPEIKWLDIPLDSVDVVEYIASRFPGQVVLVSFWGSWYGPCIAQIPYLNLLKRKLNKQPVVFVHFAVNSHEKRTKIRIADHNLEGYHSICTPEQHNKLQKAYNLESVPRYMIINQKGEIVNESAPRPAYGNLLHDEIVKTLQ